MPEDKTVDAKTGKPAPEADASKGILAELQATVTALTEKVTVLTERQAKTEDKTSSLWERLFG